MSSKKYKMLIHNEWIDSSESISVLNPFNQTEIGNVAVADKAILNQAIESAQNGFDNVKQMPAHLRSGILERTSVLLDNHKEEFAGIIAAEAGKAWKYAVGEVTRAVQTFKFAAEEAKRIHGETVPLDAAIGAENRMGFYLRQPIGIIGAITPFNFPLNLVAHKVAPAIAAGNSVVLKPASYTPLTALRLGELMLEAGLPAGALNIVIGGGSTVGNWLVEDERLAMITFTGSPVVGRHIKSKAGLKRVTLELGSNSAVILDETANLDAALPRCSLGGFANSGQVCIHVQRIYVHEKIARPFIDQFVAATQQLVVGNPQEKNCDVGPMIALSEAKRAEDWVKEAVSQGAKILCGGTRDGALFQPTVLTNVSEDMRVMRDEIFAPVVTISPFKTVDEAITRVDNSKYGLQAGIYTQDVNHAFKAIKGINVGGVMVNDVPTFRADHMPYGGNKESGIGREGLKFAIEEMTNIKMVVFNL